MAAQTMASAGIPTAWLEGCDPRQRAAMQKLLHTTLAAQALGVTHSPQFAGLTISAGGTIALPALTANRTVITNASSELATTQNLEPTASPEFTGLTLSGFSGNVGDNVVVGTGGLLQTQAASSSVVKYAEASRVATPFTIGGSVSDHVDFDTEVSDLQDWFTLASPDRITVGETGLYLAVLRLSIDAAPGVTGILDIEIAINGSGQMGGFRTEAAHDFNDGLLISASHVGLLSANDFFGVALINLASGSLDVTCNLSVTKLGVLS